MQSDNKYYIAISLLPNIGSILAKRIIAYLGSAEAVFKESKKSLSKIPGLGIQISNGILEKREECLLLADKELEFIQKHTINCVNYLEEEFPKRLEHCEDGPLLIFSKGTDCLDNQKSIAIVGTRNATEYGKEVCSELIKELKQKGYQFTVVSGLAYGIDIAAHRAAMRENVPTAAVLGHGLATVYPAVHRSDVKKLIQNGALVTEFLHNAKPDKANFVKRNRIIAGLTDATIVVESASKGGALITADIANSYNRDVFAVPGRNTDKYSSGCNRLIKTNKAALIESVEDLEYLLGWEAKTDQSAQRQLFIDLTEEEEIIKNAFCEENKLAIDFICRNSQLPMSKVSVVLLGMEFKGAVKSLPGKVYQLLV